MSSGYLFESDTAFVSCCSLDGLTGDRNINGLCSGLVTYAEAESFCDAAQMRLCLDEELELACGTGCAYDSELTWTATPLGTLK